METGNNISALSPLFKKEFHLKPDSDSALEQTDNRVLVNLNRDRIELLKVSPGLKAIEYSSFCFPNTITDSLWVSKIGEFTGSSEFNRFTNNCKVDYYLAEPHLSIVPTSIYDPVRSQQIFEFGHDTKSNSTTRSLTLDELDSVCLYSVPEQLSTLLGCTPKPSCAAWIRSAVRQSRSTTAHLYVASSRFALVIGKEQQLLFYNTFEFLKKDDILYFLMATLEGLNILYSDVSVRLSGMVNKQDGTFGILGKYISKLQLATRPKALKYAYSFNEMPEHTNPLIFYAACE